MKPRLLPVILITFAILTGNAPSAVPSFENLELIEDIDVSGTQGASGKFKEFPDGASVVETRLGKKVRVLPNDRGGVKYFGFLVGEGKGLKANGTYVLEIEYPEDVPRTVIVNNRGDEMIRGFHTGSSLGDALKPRYVDHNPESLNVPLSGKFEKAQFLMTLQARTSEIAGRRGAEIPDDRLAKRDRSPSDGFWVYIAQFEPDQDPLSHGAAVSRIRLYKAPSFDDFALKINFPPEALPRRHLFFREEMSDGIVGSEENAGFDDPNDWYVGKARLLRFLGMNTFAKDLLEFGHNQGWDSTKHGGNSWVYQTKYPERWGRIVETARAHGLSLLPYYEYAGSMGRNGLGPERRAVPLKGENYTHISWQEKGRADLTDPETFEDFRKMLEITIVDAMDRGDFVGAWLRPRGSQLPVSFSDAALNRFRSETGRKDPLSREDLLRDTELYADYLSWWKGKRRDFLAKIRDYLRDQGVSDALVLYTADPSEPGAAQPGGVRKGLVAEDPQQMENAGGRLQPVPLERAVRERWSHDAQTLPHATWANWEWQHAVPRADPENFRDEEGVLPTFTFNRAYTVGDAAALEAFETPSGLALIRHFGLNENMLRIPKGKDGKDVDPLGYFVTDMERPGPSIMLAEARAMANGNPTQIGYLASNNFNRVSPHYVRAFNAAFLALPALPAHRLAGAASDPEVVVKRIDGGGHGVWLAVVNPGYAAKERVVITLPREGRVTDAATGKGLTVERNTVTVNLYPFQLISLHIR